MLGKVSKVKNTTLNLKQLNSSKDSINKTKLKKYLIERYGSDVIIESENIPNKDLTIYIDKSKLFDITYKTFYEIKLQNYENYITMDQLINFLLEKENGGANTNATCGKYHEFMTMT